MTADQLDFYCTDLDLIDTKSVHPGNKARQSSLPCSTHTDQQEMSLWLTEDSIGRYNMNV